MPWQPTRILAVYTAPATSTRPILVDTDCGMALVKAPANPEGPHALAREWIGTIAARELGLPTFEIATIVPNSDEVAMLLSEGHVHASQGRYLAIRWEEGSTWAGNARQLQEPSNPECVSQLVVLDTWIRNRDRYLPPTATNPRGRRNDRNVWLSSGGVGSQPLMKAMDHTHCLCSEDLQVGLLRIDNAKDKRVYGMFPEFAARVEPTAVRTATSRLSEAAQRVATHDLSHIRDWAVSAEALRAVYSFLSLRAAFLSDSLLDAILAERARLLRGQGSLPFGGQS